MSLVMQADADVDDRSFPDRIVDAILSRFGVVELSESDMEPDPEDEPDPRDGWWETLAGDVELFRNGEAVVHGELCGLNAAAMRALAAALLAAANRAEAQS
ncbi:hypothetical protein [Rhodococcus pyridinivorans]|uniref:Uncharacterized protein n=1 Tax=Rhodococcus pyridinivorans TaxID=103816 RepID=A0A7M2XJK7_9NOCA|nr:hypothetical protein [Rhodococcus pyridinivorans]QOV97181.1 hypothetical protein INP59_14485 [Rhodococcus pyridinivorans]